MTDERAGSGQGPATDARNEPVVDPTKNVLDLVTAAIDRQDDLRNAEREVVEARLAHLKEIIDLRAQERMNDVAKLIDVERMRAEHTKEMRVAEAERINAIREVDNQAVQQAAQVSATQATTLAGQVAASAEAMRVQVAATASASATALANALEPITKAIEDLRRAQYEAQGQKTQVVETRSEAADMAPLYALVADLTKARDEAQGQRNQVVETRATNSNVSLIVTAFFGGLLVLLTLASLVVVLTR